MFTTEIISDNESLKKYRDEWDNLASRFNSPVLTYDWIYSCINTLYKENQLHIIVTRQGTKIEGIAPLCVDTSHEFRRLELISSSILHEPMNLIYDNREALNRLLGVLSRQKIPIVLLRMPDNEEFNLALDSISRFRSIRIKRPTTPANYIDIHSSWESYFSQLPSRRKYNFRRKRKALEKLGDVAVNIVSPNLSQLNQVLHTALAIEDSGWKGKNQSSILKVQTLRDFFVKYLNRCCESGTLRIAFLTVNDVEKAMHIAVVYANTFWVLKLAHKEEVSKCSPGLQLANETIKYCFENNLSRYEFLGSAEEWQNTWPHKQLPLCSTIILPVSFRGVLAILSLALKKLKSRLTR